MPILDKARQALAQAFADAGAAGDLLHRAGIGRLLPEFGQAQLRQLTGVVAERIAQSGSPLPAPASVAKLPLKDTVEAMLPGGRSALVRAGLQQTAGAMGRATGASAVLGGALAATKVAKPWLQGELDTTDAATYVAKNAARDGIAGAAGAATIAAVVALSGPVAPIVAVGIAVGAATATTRLLPRVEHPNAATPPALNAVEPQR